jgi:hypothetical protein
MTTSSMPPDDAARPAGAPAGIPDAIPDGAHDVGLPQHQDRTDRGPEVTPPPSPLPREGATSPAPPHDR